MEKTTDVQKYEVMLLIAPNIGDEAVTEEITKVKKLIEGSDGEIFHEDFWGIQILAYRIKKNTKGFFSILNFTLAPEKLAEIEHTLQLERNILRFLLVKTPQSYVPMKYEFTLPVRRIGRKKLKEQEKKSEPILEAKPRLMNEMNRDETVMRRSETVMRRSETIMEQVLKPELKTEASSLHADVLSPNDVFSTNKVVKIAEKEEVADGLERASEAEITSIEKASDKNVSSENGADENASVENETANGVTNEVLKPEKKETKKKNVTPDLDSIDKKLKSIIDNPDISL
ncbi:30S ribosomal protein S6 [Candidatus Peregrinibacteria bacterium]|nr:30S ribosomal protein S6 [Candidatus Peregrinibacteria bacterium]